MRESLLVTGCRPIFVALNEYLGYSPYQSLEAFRARYFTGVLLQFRDRLTFTRGSYFLPQ